MEIKSCPFCKGIAEIRSCAGDFSVRGGKPFFWVQHYNRKCPIRLMGTSNSRSGMETHYYDSPEEAITSWNKGR